MNDGERHVYWPYFNLRSSRERQKKLDQKANSDFTVRSEIFVMGVDRICSQERLLQGAETTKQAYTTLPNSCTVGEASNAPLSLSLSLCSMPTYMRSPSCYIESSFVTQRWLRESTEASVHNDSNHEAGSWEAA